MAVAGGLFVVWSLGVPALFGWQLYKNRHTIMSGNVNYVRSQPNRLFLCLSLWNRYSKQPLSSSKRAVAVAGRHRGAPSALYVLQAALLHVRGLVHDRKAPADRGGPTDLGVLRRVLPGERNGADYQQLYALPDRW